MMLMKALKLAAAPAVLLFLADMASAQTGSISGKVTGEDGAPIMGAMVKIERQDVRGNYKVKTKKKGNFFHAGLPLGTYLVKLEVAGQVVDQVGGVRVGLGEPTEVDFDLAEVKRRREEAQMAAQGGTTPDAVREMSAEERKKFEDAIQKRQQQLSKNKALNEAFNAGMTAKQMQNFDTAVAKFKEASELDPEQHVVWANLGEVQSQLALSKTGAERSQLTADGIASYKKAIELQPENSAYYNNLGLAMVKGGNQEEGIDMLTKAATLDPINGGRYFYNLGAVMVNAGDNQGAVDAFKKAVETDPTYADAYFQLGTVLVGMAETLEDGSVKPVDGTVEAFQKYIELKPDGPYAPTAQSMIQGLSGKVETEYEDPDKKKRRRKSSSSGG